MGARGIKDLSAVLALHSGSAVSHPIAALIVEQVISRPDGSLELPPERAKSLEQHLGQLAQIGPALIAVLDLARAADRHGQPQLADQLVAVAAAHAGTLGKENTATFAAKAAKNAAMQAITGRRPLNFARDPNLRGRPMHTFEPIVSSPRRA